MHQQQIMTTLLAVVGEVAGGGGGGGRSRQYELQRTVSVETCAHTPIVWCAVPTAIPKPRANPTIPPCLASACLASLASPQPTRARWIALNSLNAGVYQHPVTGCRALFHETPPVCRWCRFLIPSSAPRMSSGADGDACKLRSDSP